MRFILTAFCLSALLSLNGQIIPNPDLLVKGWSARWIMPPGASATGYGVYHFRKSIELPQLPASFVIHVSGDNRYRLFVNGKAVCEGPARSDAANWHYETIDIAPYLKAGKNVLAALVWNMGEGKPFAQMSFQTGFIVQGNGPAEQLVNTGEDWKCFHNEAYKPLPPDRAALQTYLVTGDGDLVDGSRYPWGWEQPGYDDSAWPASEALWFVAKPRGVGTDGNWILSPRGIPMMEQHVERLAAVRQAEGVAITPAFVTGKQPFEVPARSHVKILFDQSHLTNAYPELWVSGGKGATVTLSYAEAMVDEQRQKGNRNEVTGKQIIGVQDRFVMDGGTKRQYRPLWWRCYRYLEMEIETGAEPLTVLDLYGMFTGYPFEEKGAFSSSDPTLSNIWAVGWRTARLCAGENYFDCPYYEQYQYTGDTRIQALISLYVSGDDRLMRKAINDFSHSFIPEGLPQSRYPSADPQIIPTYSLFWISMIHDYWMHRTDDAFILSHKKGIRDVLDWFEARQRADGMLGKVEWWNFVDWAWPWEEDSRMGGVPKGAFTGGSSILSLQYAYTLNQAADLYDYWGDPKTARTYRKQAQILTSATYAQCWDNTRQILADTPEKQDFSQHANILAVLTNAVPAKEQKALIQRISADTSLTQCTFYFKFYLFEALKKVKLGDAFLPELAPWHDMLAMGLSTFAENPEPTRSDCHAWSASPNYELLSLVCGINTAAPGFSRVRIEPFLGSLTQVSGCVPHPKGMISVEFRREGSQLSGSITLPEGLSGELLWEGKKVALSPGKQEIRP